MIGETYTPGFRQARAEHLVMAAGSGDRLAPESSLGIIGKRLEDLSSRLTSTTIRLMAANDRAFGPVPQVAEGGGAGGNSPSALVDEIHALIDRVTSTAIWLDSEVSRTERL